MKLAQVTAARIGAGLLLGLALTGCLTDPVSVPEGDRPAHVTFEMVSDPVARTGGFAPDVDRLIVVMTSSTRDTLRDTITAAGSRLSIEPVWLDGTAGRLHLFARYDLAPGRRWNIDITSRDANDTVVHHEAVRLDDLQAFEYRSARIDMAPRWVGHAVKVTLPAVRTMYGSTCSVRFQRVELLVDGVIVRDTVVSAKTRELLLSHPYVAPGSHTIDFRAYGMADESAVAAATSGLLLKGSTTIEVAPGKAVTERAVSLDWNDAAGAEAPETSGASLRLGAVGRVTLNVKVPGAIDL